MIKIRELFKSFTSGGSDIQIFENFDLEIASGELVVIFGPSGCGKSTLVNIIGGTEQYSRGAIEGLSKKDRIGYISQSNSLLPWLNVIDNIAFGLKLQGVDKVTRYKEAHDLLEEMGLASYADFYPHQLSGGLAQLISFARSVAHKAEFMLMDEPFSSLDFLVRNRIQDIILKIHRKRHLSTIFITHNADEAVYLGDRIIALSATKPTAIVKEFTTADITDKEADNFHKVRRELLACYL